MAAAFAAAALCGFADDSTVLFYGGAGRVGGSCAVVDKDGYRVLVDCGTRYGEEKPKKRRAADSERFGFDPHDIRNVVVTHAHQDHAGRLPELVRAGFGGTIWMTQPTLDILSVTWRGQVRYDDSARNWTWSERAASKTRIVHWRAECRSARKIGNRNRCAFVGNFRDVERHVLGRDEAVANVIPCRECDLAELAETRRRVRTVDFGKPLVLGPFSVVFRPTKHLPGAASVTFRDGVATWTFSGDLGTRRSRLVERIDPAEKVDAVFVETTSGDSAFGDSGTTETERLRFRQTVGERVKGGGLAWIPAFALDRSQRVLLETKVGMDEGLIPTNAPVYYLSPSSRDIAEEYVSHPEWFDNDSMTGLSGLLARLQKRFESVNYKGGGGILISTSGMMDAGASFAMIPDLVSRNDVTVCLVGYQAAGTPGQKLRRGAKSLKMPDGEKVEVRCRVESFRCFSAHADAREADEWLANNWRSKIYLVHGDADSLARRKAGLEERYKAYVEVARPGVKYVMRPNSQTCQLCTITCP